MTLYSPNGTIWPYMALYGPILDHRVLWQRRRAGRLTQPAGTSAVLEYAVREAIWPCMALYIVLYGAIWPYMALYTGYQEAPVNRVREA